MEYVILSIILFFPIYFALNYLGNVDRWLYWLVVLATTIFISGEYFNFWPSVLPENSNLFANAYDYVEAKYGAIVLFHRVVDVLVITFVYTMLTIWLKFLRSLQNFSWKSIYNTVGHHSLKMVSWIPFFQSKYDEEMGKVEQTIRKSLKPDHASTRSNMFLPEKGIPDDQLLMELTEKATAENQIWQDGKVSGAVYHGEPQHLDVLNQASALYHVANPLHADIWPSLGQMEAECIQMTASLLNGGNEQVCGVMTSGGTESIVLAAKSHRDWYAKEKGVTKPRIIAAVTAHAAIDKACDLMGIELIKVPVDPKTYKISIEAVRWQITGNTIMLYGSAPNYPNGVIDDIEQLSALAQQYDVGLHVDCCLGGFVLPFMRNLGYSVPPFDFELPGVTSMSCDTHKYGYAAKGTSIVLYKSKQIRQYQYFCFPEWTGGLYVTPTIAGSRPGALSAACWASLMRLGEEGFLQRTKEIIETADAIRAGIQEMENDNLGLELVGDSMAMVVCFKSSVFNSLEIGDRMSKKGWNLNSLQYPASIHICVTIRHVGKVNTFLTDLKEVAAELLAEAQDPEIENKPEGSSAIYGMASALPKGPVEEVLKTYTDITLEP